jgi:hypothetical protein
MVYNSTYTQSVLRYGGGLLGQREGANPNHWILILRDPAPLP